MQDHGDRPGAAPHVAFVVDRPHLAAFLLLFQQGAMLRCRAGRSVLAFLHDEIGAAPEEIEQIQSIVLDGRPVDDIGSALVHTGSTLALSAAMPGLVGATLRRGGAYSSFRSAITHQEHGAASGAEDGWVRVKLFNLLMAELGPRLLRKGVLVEAADLRGCIAGLPTELPEGSAVTLDGGPVSLERLREGAGPAGAAKVLLTVSAQ